jgi:hypothetical protein
MVSVGERATDRPALALPKITILGSSAIRRHGVLSRNRLDELKDQFRRFRTGHHPADLRRR